MTVAIHQSGQLRVQPGELLVVEVRVQNAGTVVDDVTIEIDGDAASWARVVPAEMHLLPATEGVVSVEFRPPAASTPASGVHAFGVSARSKAAEACRDSAESTVEVGRHAALRAAISPRTSRSARTGLHQVALVNDGNAPVAVALEVREPDMQLEVAIEPSATVLVPGASATATVRVSRGESASLGEAVPFQVVVRPEGQDDQVLDAAFVPLRRLVIPRVVVAVAGVLLVALLALAGGLFVWSQSRPEPTPRHGAYGSAYLLKYLPATVDGRDLGSISYETGTLMIQNGDKVLPGLLSKYGVGASEVDMAARVGKAKWMVGILAFHFGAAPMADQVSAAATLFAEESGSIGNTKLGGTAVVRVTTISEEVYYLYGASDVVLGATGQQEDDAIVTNAFCAVAKLHC